MRTRSAGRRSSQWQRGWAALLLAVTATLIAVGREVRAESSYLGCYVDRFPARERDLGAMVALDEARMSPAFCEEVCGRRHQFRYFGLQYGMECWCGTEYGRYGLAEGVDACSKPCNGDPEQKCGGELTNSVYEMSPYPPLPAHADGRPLLGLVMIVKNESHTLPATLRTIAPWIDVYYILDTGSTDGTQEAIRDALGASRGEVWEEAFIDYGRSRNRALDIAASSTRLGGPPIFSLMLSADETLINGAGLRRFCEEHRDLHDAPNEEAYYIQMDVGWRFDSARLSRTDKGWRYKGRVHEYLASPKGRGSPTLRVPDTYVKFKVTDPERRSAREFTILRILQEEVAEKPRDTRASFYLARTYNVVKNHSASLAEFQRRVSLGGWKEEVYESLYAIAWQKEALQRPWHEVQQAFMDAHAHSPERAEPLYAIASHWYRSKSPSLAYLFASYASGLAYPTGASLWVQADVYGWQCWMIMGMTGIDAGREREGAKALIRAMTKRAKDKGMQAMARKYRALLGVSVWDELECEVDPLHCRSRQRVRRPDALSLMDAADVEPASQLPSAQPAAVPLPFVAHHPPEEAVQVQVHALSEGGPDPERQGWATGSEHGSLPRWAMAVGAALLLSNGLLLMALRRSRRGGSSARACIGIATSLSHCPAVHGNDKDV